MTVSAGPGSTPPEGDTCSRVSDVAWDPSRSVYSGMVTFSGPAGLSMMRVSAAGLPGWGHQRVSAALTAAGRAQGGDRPVLAPASGTPA
jgi:hypothetical protein